MRYIFYFLVFGATLVTTVVIIPLAIRMAYRWNVVDQPGERKVHHTVKPLLGGVAIFLSFHIIVVGSLIGFLIFHDISWIQNHFPSIVRLYPRLHSVFPKLGFIFAGGIFIHIIGLTDDIFKGKVTYKLKFIVQFAVIFLVVLGGIRIDFMPNRALDIIVSVAWILGITNSFNLLDNMDGLMSGVAVICAGLLFCVAVLQGQIFFAFILAALAGACLGFLTYNLYPSRVFMGDSGSLFLGYLFGTITVTGSYVVKTSSSLLPIAIPVLVFSIPLYDTFSVMFIRWREKRPFFIGDKKHFSHRLVEIGMSHRSAVIFIYLLCFCVGIVSILLPYISLAAGILVLVQATTIYILITILIAVGRENKDNAKKAE